MSQSSLEILDANLMDGSDDEDAIILCPKWKLYSLREEWKDITPIPQDDGPHPIVAIAYTNSFKDTYDYFRAIIKKGEKSERAFDLTTDCIQFNATNYTVWQYRREILRELKKDLREELKYVEGVIKQASKNYQVWHHRRVILSELGDASGELAFTDLIFRKDAKNYHAWQHRQWCIKTFNMFDNELEYLDLLLTKDIRNNSAWNQRFFVIQNTTKFEPEIIEREVDYTLSKIRKVNKNESSWSYLRSILSYDKNGGLVSNEKVLTYCKDLYNSGNRTNFLLICIIDIIEEKYKSDCPMDEFYNMNKALELCQLLGEKYDEIRAKYWSYVSHRLKKTFENTKL